MRATSEHEEHGVYFTYTEIFIINVILDMENVMETFRQALQIAAVIAFFVALGYCTRADQSGWAEQQKSDYADHLWGF